MQIKIKLDCETIAMENQLGFSLLTDDTVSALKYISAKRGHGFNNYRFKACLESKTYSGHIKGSVKELDLAMCDIEFYGINPEDFENHIEPLLDDY